MQFSINLEKLKKYVPKTNSSTPRHTPYQSSNYYPWYLSMQRMGYKYAQIWLSSALQPSRSPHARDTASLMPRITQILSIIFYVCYDMKKVGKHWQRSSYICMADTYTEIYAYIRAMFVIIKNWNIPNVRQSIFLLISARMLPQCNEN